MVLHRHSQPADPIIWEEGIKLINSLIEDKKHTWALFVATGIFTGLRFSDITQLTLSDLKEDKIVIREKKTAKTKKYREITLSENFKEIRDKCIPFVKKQKPFDFTIQWANKRLKEMKTKYGLNCENISNHSLRKCFSLKVWELHGKTEEGLTTLSEMLNHSNNSTTRKYLGINRQKIATVYSSL